MSISRRVPPPRLSFMKEATTCKRYRLYKESDTRRWILPMVDCGIRRSRLCGIAAEWREIRARSAVRSRDKRNGRNPTAAVARVKSRGIATQRGRRGRGRLRESRRTRNGGLGQTSVHARGTLALRHEYRLADIKNMVGQLRVAPRCLHCDSLLIPVGLKRRVETGGGLPALGSALFCATATQTPRRQKGWRRRRRARPATSITHEAKLKNYHTKVYPLFGERVVPARRSSLLCADVRGLIPREGTFL